MPHVVLIDALNKFSFIFLWLIYIPVTRRQQCAWFLSDAFSWVHFCVELLFHISVNVVYCFRMRLINK